MSTYTEEIGEKLNALLEKTYDTEKGFRKAAENFENEALKDYFTKKADERYVFGRELKEEFKSLPADIYKFKNLKGTIHRAWIDIKSMFSFEDEESVLEEAIRGEKASLNEYKNIMKSLYLPSSIKSILESQKNKIENGLFNIKSLEQVY